MEISGKKRLGAGVALVLLSPALIASISGCGSNCDNNRSTLTTSDDCGVGGRRGGFFGGFFGGGRRNSGSGGSVSSGSGVRSGGFGSFGRSFSGGG